MREFWSQDDDAAAARFRADLIAPTLIDVLHHSRCPRGHDNALAPAVLEHLRSLE